MLEQEFDKLLLEAVDEGLSTLGESSKQAIYYHLKRSFGIEKEEIPQKIEFFTAAIEKIFGLGANFLEILIMKKLYEKLGRSFRWHSRGDFTFIEYVEAARRSFLAKNKVQLMTEKLAKFEEMEVKR